MKKISSLLLLFVCFNAFAQTEFSVLFTVPPTALQSLKNENPYVLVQQMNGTNWENLYLYRNVKAPHVDTPGFSSSAEWQDGNTWKDSETRNDSFILDNQGRIAVQYKDIKLFNSSGSVVDIASKYTFGYDNSGRRNKVQMQYGEEPDNTTFYNFADITFMYNQNGRREYDSIYMYEKGLIEYVYFIYDNQGRLTNQFIIQDLDTLNKTYITYNGQNIATTKTLTSKENEEWLVSSADSITYDAQGRMKKLFQWGLVYNSGSGLSTQLITDETYHYNGANKPDEIISMTNGGSRITLEYDAANKPTIGYEYGLGATEPFKRYFFEVPTTGIADVYGNAINASVYPNPASSLVMIDLKNPQDKIREIKMFDLQGKSVSPVINTDHTIDVSSLSNGIYSLIAITGNGAFAQKISVQH